MDDPVKASLAVLSEEAGLVSAQISVDKGGKHYCFETTLSLDDAGASRNETLAAEGRRQITWLPPYLLVQSDLSTRQEFVNQTSVFKEAEGTLIKVGALGGDVSREVSGRFLSLYNKGSVWREMGFDCEACKPQVRLAIDELGGALVADPEETWRINQQELRDNDQYIQSEIGSLPPPEEDSPTRMLVLRSLTENAVIAKYCGRDAEVGKLLALASAHLDQDEQDQLAQSLNGTIPGEIPDQWGAAWGER